MPVLSTPPRSERYGPFRPLRKLIAGFCVLLAALIMAAPASAEPIVVAVLGDSLVQGYGLPDGDGFVPQMQRWLAEHGTEARLINAGVSGDTTAGGLSRIGWTLTPDVGALVVSLGGNDVLRGLPPELSRKNLEGILETATQKGVPVLLIGISAPGNYGKDYKATFDAIYPDLAARYHALLYPNFLLALQRLPDRQATLEEYFQADAIHPNAKGVALIVEDMGPHFQKLIAEAGKE